MAKDTGALTLKQKVPLFERGKEHRKELVKQYGRLQIPSGLRVSPPTVGHLQQIEDPGQALFGGGGCQMIAIGWTSGLMEQTLQEVVDIKHDKTDDIF